MVMKLENCCRNVMKMIGEKQYYFLLLVLGIYFLCNFAEGLIAGGGWDLYQAVATADRFLNGKGFYYSAIEASTPYFPGVSFLAVFVGKLFYNWRDYILLAIASIVGTFLLYELICIGRKMSINKWVTLFLSAYFLFFKFDSYRSYMREFKPDSMILCLGIIIVCILDKVEQKKKVSTTSLLLFSILSFFMGLFKQHALYIDIAIGGYLLFAKDVKRRIAIIMSMVVGGIMDLLVIFSIPNISIQTIACVGDMPWKEISEIIFELFRLCKSNYVFLILLMIYFYCVLTKRIQMKAFEIKWLLVSIMFSLGSFAGGMKIGGNVGNYEVALICFLPYVVSAADYLINEFIKQEKRKYISAMSVVFTLGIMISSCRYFANSELDNIFTALETNAEITEYLSNNFEGETLMYYSNRYMEIVRSSAEPGMDVYSTPRYTEEYVYLLDDTLEAKEYKYLYVRENEFAVWDEMEKTYMNKETRSVDLLKQNYEVIDDPEMPDSLKGNLYKAIE